MKPKVINYLTKNLLTILVILLFVIYVASDFKQNYNYTMQKQQKNVTVEKILYKVKTECVDVAGDNQKCFDYLRQVFDINIKYIYEN